MIRYPKTRFGRRSGLLEAAAQPEDGFAIRDRDVVAMTEAIVARAQGNYASVDDIAAEGRMALASLAKMTSASAPQSRIRSM